MELAKKPAQSTLIGIVGSTASGKTGLSLRLARELQADILCVDSRTICRHMDIGTAKPTPVERAEIAHFGLDLIYPDEVYTVYDFAVFARSIIDDYVYRKKPLILVGGSGLYFDALLFGYQFRQTQQSRQSFDQYSMDELVDHARKLYPNEIMTIDVKNRRRVEQLLALGPVNTQDRKSLKYSIQVHGIMPESLQIKQNISERTINMLKQGFVQEVETLRQHYGVDCPRLHTTGYAVVSQYLDGIIPESQVANRIETDTYILAKKQITWFKRNSFISWHPSSDTAFRSIMADA